MHFFICCWGKGLGKWILNVKWNSIVLFRIIFINCLVHVCTQIKHACEIKIKNERIIVQNNKPKGTAIQCFYNFSMLSISDIKANEQLEDWHSCKHTGITYKIVNDLFLFFSRAWGGAITFFFILPWDIWPAFCSHSREFAFFCFQKMLALRVGQGGMEFYVSLNPIPHLTSI